MASIYNIQQLIGKKQMNIESHLITKKHLTESIIDLFLIHLVTKAH